MTYTGIFCLSGALALKAGYGVNSAVVADSFLNEVMTEAESTINMLTRKNWSDLYSGLNADVKGCLSECASNLGAMYMINYDMSGFLSLAEAGKRLDVLYDGFNRNIKLLQDLKQQDFIVGA